jgi:hypothetical protein
VSVDVPALPQVGKLAAPPLAGDYPAPLGRLVVRGTTHAWPRVPAVEADEAGLIGGLLAAETAEVEDRVVRHRERHDPVCAVPAALLPARRGRSGEGSGGRRSGKDRRADSGPDQ